VGAPAPVGCYGHTAVLLNGLVYVGGGKEAGKKESWSINSYDLVNNSWSSLINTPYCYFAMTTLNNNLLIAGGKDKSNKKTDEILTLDASQLKNYTKMITARSSATAIGHQGMFIITGGVDDKGNSISSTEMFDSNSGQWYICNDLPQPLSGLKFAIADNILYLLGGYSKDGPSSAVFSASLDTLSKYQLKWNIYQDIPWNRVAPVSMHSKHLLIVGGLKQMGGKPVLTSNIYKLNKISHSWEAIGRIPLARDASAAVSTIDNRVIVIGGLHDNAQFTNTVWIGSCEPQSL